MAHKHVRRAGSLSKGGSKRGASSKTGSIPRVSRKASPVKRLTAQLRPPRLDKLTVRQRSARDRSLTVLRLMRSGQSFRSATDEVGIDRRTARRYLGSALRGLESGRLSASTHDNLVREVPFLNASGEITKIRVYGDRDASLAGHYLSDLNRLTNPPKDPARRITLQEFVEKWRGVRVGKHEFLADEEKFKSFTEAGLNLRIEGFPSSWSAKSSGGGK